MAPGDQTQFTHELNGLEILGNTSYSTEAWDKTISSCRILDNLRYEKEGKNLDNGSYTFGLKPPLF